MLTTLPINLIDNKEKIAICARLFEEYLGCDFLNIEAVFSDETKNFVTHDKNGFTIKIRAFKNNLHDNAYVHIINNDQETKHKMLFSESEGCFDFFKLTMPVETPITYYFSIENNNRVYFYNKRGLFLELDHNYNFKLYPDFNIPSWAVGAVWYQIYVDRFCNGDTSNDVVNNEYEYLGHAAKKINDWYSEVSTDDVCNFYGGDLKGVMQKMEYLKTLGVEVIYFNPIFVSPSNHKYDAQDYDYVDPHYGVIINESGEPLRFEKFNNRYATMYINRTTNKENLEASNQLFCDLVQLAHDNGIKIILDGVFNHCGAFNKWLDKENFYHGDGYQVGAYRDENSPYHDYFSWYDTNWPNNDCYSGWWNHENHPKLNFEGSKELYDYMLEVGRKWVSPPFNADGWRLDVAADLGNSPEFNHKFWKDFRRAVKEANKDAIILAEHYGDVTPWLYGDEWDTVMNYDAFMEPVTWFLTGMEKHSEEFKPDLLCNAMAFEGAMRYHMSKFSINALQSAMNQLSNHDHSRFLTRTNMTAGRLHTKGSAQAEQGIKKSIFMEAVTMLMTWPGSPAIYYGDEVGLCGWTDPDDRRPFPWGREDKMLLDFHRKIVTLRKNNPVLRTGSLEFLHNDYGILSYGRFDDSAKIAVLINNNNANKKLTIPVWKIGVALNGKMELLIHTLSDDYSNESMKYDIVNGFLEITLAPHSSMILKEIS